MPEEQAPYAGLSDKQFIAKGRQRHEACFSVDSHGRPVTFLQGCVYAARHALPEALRRLAEKEDADERENEVWEEIIRECHKAWPEKEKIFYNDSPIELIWDLIAERDRLRAEVKRLQKHIGRENVAAGVQFHD